MYFPWINPGTRCSGSWASICHKLYSRFIRKSIQLPLVAREFVPSLPRDLLDKNVGYLWSYQDIKLNLLNMVECLTLYIYIYLIYIYIL